MDTDTDSLRALLATLLYVGDYQELMSLYQSTDHVVPPERLDEIYDADALDASDRKAADEIAAAIPDELLPALDQRITVPAEMVELVARHAFEAGKDIMAMRALREADTLDRAYQRFADYALESLGSGEDARAAFELRLAGRLGWARLAPEERLEFVVGLGVDAAELAYSLGGESARGRISNARPLADFPAWQTYGPLFHARCRHETCIAGMPLDLAAPLALRFLLHDAELTEKALQEADGDAPRLLRACAIDADPGLQEYADRYARAEGRFRELEEVTRAGDVRAQPEAEKTEPEAETSEGGDNGEVPAEGTPDGPDAEGVASDESAEVDDSEVDREEAIREGLEEVQALLVGHPVKEWRDCLAQLCMQHPLSVFTVCTLQAQGIANYVVPVGANGTQFLEAVLTPQ